MKRDLWKLFQKELVIWRVGALPGIAVIGLIVALRLAGTLQFLEWKMLDTLLRLRPVESKDERIVIVGINESDIRRIGTYPIPDRDIADLLRRLQTYQPAVIGLDIVRDLPVQPGHADLVKTFKELKNLIAVEIARPDSDGLSVNPPPSLPPEQIGFADAILDADGSLRRSLLGFHKRKNDYRFSLTLRLAETYLATKGIDLDNGIQDPEAMRFGSTELKRFQPNSGGYVNADAGGNQILINFRNGRNLFRHLSLQDIQTGKVDPAWIRRNIVLIGVTAPSIKDIINSSAIADDNPALIYGVEVQAHAVSQITSAVLDHRPLLKVWSEGWEYFWIIIWGILGISLGRVMRSPLKILLGLAITSAILLGLSYGLILGGWWVPIVPSLLVLILNGAGLTASLFYRYEQDLQARVRDRQLIIDHTFNTIHNGPLQTLARMLQEAQEEIPQPQLLLKLQHLNQELRAVYESVRQETLSQGGHFYLGQGQELDLQNSIHEALYEVFSHVLKRDFPNFKAIKLKVTTFEPLDERHLSLDQKRGLCRFLEEALCNVGKHAIGVKRLEVTCTQKNGQNIIRVVDDGAGTAECDRFSKSEHKGLGTQQAKNLAKQLGGKFQRIPREPRGTICELTWSATKFWFWRL